MSGHWTRIMAAGATCAGCGAVLTAAPDTVWSNERGLYCGPGCVPEGEEVYRETTEETL